MASSTSLLHSLPLTNHRSTITTIRCHSPHALPPLRGRRLSLPLLSSPAAAAMLARASLSRAEDIPLFGLRKKLKKVEEEAEEIMKEGEVAVEKEIQLAEEGIKAAEEQIAGELGFGFGGDLV